MAIVRITLSEDFDERYEKYRSKHDDKKMPEPFLVEQMFDEREYIASINNRDEFEHEIAKWKPLKAITDAVYKELSPYSKSVQNIKIDTSKLGVSENTANSILTLLVNEGLCRLNLNFKNIIENAPLVKYTENDGIMVRDYVQFRDFKKQVDDFYSFIEGQRKEKFVKEEVIKTVEDFRLGPSDFQVKFLEQKLEEIKKEDELADRIINKIENKFQTKTPIPYNNAKWWGLDSVPLYHRDDYLITLEDRKCDIGSNALNQQVICELLFDFNKKPIGEWVIEYEVKSSFSNRGKKPGNRAFADAVEDLNKKIKKDLGIEGMLEYKSGPPKVRIKPSFFKEEKLVKEKSVNQN